MKTGNSASITDEKLRVFGLLLGAITVVLFGLLPPLLWSSNWPAWPWIVAGLLALPAIAAPAMLRPAYAAWMRIGAVLGWFNTRLLLLIVFCALMVPIGLIMRMAGRDPMERRIDKKRKTYRVPSRKAEPRHMNTPY